MSDALDRKQEIAFENWHKAVSHPVRARIHRILQERAASPSEMARELDEDVSLVAHHTKHLVKLGCAELAYDRKVHGRAVEHVYRGIQRIVIDDAMWAKLSPELGQHLVREWMQWIVDDFSEAAKKKTVGHDDNFHVTRTPVVLDDEGVKRTKRIYEEAREQMIEVQEEVSERGGETIRWSSCLAAFPLDKPPAVDEI